MIGEKYPVAWRLNAWLTGLSLTPATLTHGPYG
jgi:hypothetical protein